MVEVRCDEDLRRMGLVDCLLGVAYTRALVFPVVKEMTCGGEMRRGGVRSSVAKKLARALCKMLCVPHLAHAQTMRFRVARAFVIEGSLVDFALLLSCARGGRLA